jgi:hypothetical protein
MKIYRSAVYQMTAEGLVLLEEDSFEYDGPISHCGGKGGSPPATPNPTAVAQAQTQAGEGAAAFNAALNRINTTTPYGSQTYTVNGYDPTTGAPIYSQNISLSPQQQALYDQQTQQNLQLGGLGGSLINQAQGTTGQPIQAPNIQSQIDRSGIPGIPGAGNLSQFTQQAQDAAYKNATQYLDPQFARQEEQLKAQLANSGATVGSEAYNNAMNQFDEQKRAAYANAQNQAVQQGLAEQQALYQEGANTNQQMFGQNLSAAQFGNQAAQQGLQQQLAIRNEPINELSAIRSNSQVQLPQYQQTAQAGTQPANIAQYMQNAYQGNLDLYNQRQATNNATLGDLTSLAAAYFLGGG